MLDRYRAGGPRVGALVAMGAAGALALTHRRMSKPQLLPAFNMLALLVHQHAESEDPGYFPGQFSGGMFHSDKPDRYPLNTNTGMDRRASRWIASKAGRQPTSSRLVGWRRRLAAEAANTVYAARPADTSRYVAALRS